MSVAEWETKDKNRLRKWLGEHLAYGPVTVVFEKKDGTLREMRCTLKDVPQYERKTESETTRKKNDEVMVLCFGLKLIDIYHLLINLFFEIYLNIYF